MDLLAEVVREAPVPLWLIDSQGLVALANLEAIRFLGYRKENDVVGGPSHELLHRSRPDGTPYPEHECPIVGSAGSAPATECFVTRAGDARPVRWSTRSISDGHATLLSFSPEPRAEAQIVRELRSRGPGPRTSPAQARAELRESLCRTISSRFTDPQFTTAELAASAHLSVRSVQALFAETGTSPAAEIRRVRLEHARALLGRGHAVQTACLASGFLDPGTFARAFRQRFGTRPARCRRRWLRCRPGSALWRRSIANPHPPLIAIETHSHISSRHVHFEIIRRSVHSYCRSAPAIRLFKYSAPGVHGQRERWFRIRGWIYRA